MENEETVTYNHFSICTISKTAQHSFLRLLQFLKMFMNLKYTSFLIFARLKRNEISYSSKSFNAFSGFYTRVKVKS